MPSDNFTRLQFYSDRIPAAHRHGAVREILGREIGMDIDAYPGRPILGNFDFLILPGVQTFIAETLAIGRRTHKLTRDGDDMICVALGTTGDFFLSQRGQENVIRRGSGSVLLWNELLTVRSTGGMANGSMGILLPRASLAPLIRDLNDRAGHLVGPHSEAVALLASYVTILQATPNISRQMAHAASQHIQDLIVLALGGHRDARAAAATRGLRAARLQQIKHFMIANSGRLDMSVALAAVQNHVTERYIQRLFEAEGTTFSLFLLEERLQQAYHRLSSPRWLDCTIAHISFESGFSEITYFNRAFRRRFGLTPSDVRAQAPSLSKRP